MADYPPTNSTIADPNAVIETYVERVMAHRSEDNIILTFLAERPFSTPKGTEPVLTVVSRLVMHYSVANDFIEKMVKLREGIALQEAKPSGSA